MDSEEGRGEGNAHTPDLVVVDRTALKELLTAVINTLKAAENVDAMPADAAESSDYAEVRQAIASARHGLIGGIERIAAAVDELPSAVVKKKGKTDPS